MTQKNDEWNNKHLAKTTQPDFYQFEPFYRFVDIKLEGYCRKGEAGLPHLSVSNSYCRAPTRYFFQCLWLYVNPCYSDMSVLQ